MQSRLRDCASDPCEVTNWGIWASLVFLTKRLHLVNFKDSQLATTKRVGGMTMWRNRGSWIGLLAAMTVLPQFSAVVRAQGIIVDRRRTVPVAHSYEIREVKIDGRVRDQVAEVQVSQTFHNPNSFPLESEFLFPLPEEGAIQNFVLMVDGAELPGRLLPKDEARRIYEEIVRTKRDPALLEYMGRGLYRTSVFPIPPGADRKVTMRYTQLCKRERDVVEFGYPLGTQKFTSKPIERLLIQVSIESREAIKSVYCPSDDVSIQRSGDRDVRVSLDRRDITPSRDFRLVYTLADGAFAASVLSVRPSASEDGYFLLLASPEVKAADTRPLPKTVVFVIDRSGSMAGKKIEQARKALTSVLNNLSDEDLFNIVVYDDRAESFKPELQRFGPTSRSEAERFVDNIREGGSTNIDGALKMALGMVRDSSRPSYVLFLTDGLPTAGETRELPIAENCRQVNGRRARIFCFGVGYDVNARLLDRISGGNSGTSEYVKPDEDIETHVAGFYSKMTRPVLADIRLEFTGIDVNRTYPRDLPDLFHGGQIVWAGRYRQSGRTTIKMEGKVSGERRSLEFPAELAAPGTGTGHDFIEGIWAARRLGELIDQIDMHGQSRELVEELVALSTKYGILTPYTSFLADERTVLHAGIPNARQAGEALVELNQTSGQSGVEQREVKQDLMRADNSAVRFSYEGRGGAAGPVSAPAAAKHRAQMGAAGRSRAPLIVGTQGGGLDNFRPAGDSKSAEPADKVRKVGAKTFFWKGQRWVDSSVTAEDEKKATSITQLTDEYFALARTQKAEFNQYLSMDQPVTVKLDDKVYRIDPSKAEGIP
jgi:Ca-activated chloride channel homolog